MGFIVAIDGPAGAGKSTVARGVATGLGLVHLNTGSLYRAVTLSVIESGSAPESWGDLTRSLSLEFRADRVYLDGRDVTERIREADVTARVSEVAAHPDVRQSLLGLQRRMGEAAVPGAVLEGRDIGTVVFPHADLKVFLTATAEERARRRHAELTREPTSSTLDLVLDELKARDRYDSERAVAPLRAADDAIEIDSTGRTVDAVVDSVIRLARARGGPTPP